VSGNMLSAKAIRAAAILALLAVAAPASPAWAQAGRGIVADAAGPHADREFMIGRWSDTGDCGDSVLLEPSGRFTASDGGEGRWTMDGDELTLLGVSALTVRIVPVDHDTIDIVNEDGSLGRSIRCETELRDPNGVVEVI
jgi:hypothetical protein